MEDLGCANVWRHDDAVVHPLTLSPRLNNARPPKIRKVPRDFRLPLLKYLHEKADAYLPISHEVEQAEASGVSEGLKEEFDVKG